MTTMYVDGLSITHGPTDYTQNFTYLYAVLLKNFTHYAQYLFLNSHALLIY